MHDSPLEEAGFELFHMLVQEVILRDGVNIAARLQAIAETGGKFALARELQLRDDLVAQRDAHSACLFVPAAKLDRILAAP